jgi:hypothetical protein
LRYCDKDCSLLLLSSEFQIYLYIEHPPYPLLCYRSHQTLQTELPEYCGSGVESCGRPSSIALSLYMLNKLCSCFPLFYCHSPNSESHRSIINLTRGAYLGLTSALTVDSTLSLLPLNGGFCSRSPISALIASTTQLGLISRSETHLMTHFYCP